MDTYHEMLVKLYEVTGGKDNKSVDLKDLVRKAGLNASYANIFRHLSEEGWIAEDMKADFVRITQWGVAEAKKAQTPLSEDEKKSNANIRSSVVLAKDFVNVIETFAADSSNENLEKVKNKFEELEKAVKLIN